MATTAEAPPLDVSLEALSTYVTELFEASGMSRGPASRLTNSLLLANRSGHDSHGIIRIPQYLEGIQRGSMDATIEPKVKLEGPAYVVVDGQWGFGQETARFAMAKAAEKARACGVGMATTIRTNHIGRLGEWAEQAAADGVIGLVCVAIAGAGGKAVAPFGGAERALSTNPLAIGIPREGQAPLLLDWATSILPEGKVRFARDKGVPVPPGCLLDKDGNPTTDPNDFYNGGMLLPFAGHKGYALSLMIEVLGTLLGGAELPENEDPRGVYSGAWFLAIDPTHTRRDGGFGNGLELLCARMLGVKPAPGFERVMLPGEPEHLTRLSRSESISVPAATWSAIAAHAERLGVGIPGS
jgi:LDH2 family malate/lactate/ureidoglycolate dehydrogenase